MTLLTFFDCSEIPTQHHTTNLEKAIMSSRGNPRVGVYIGFLKELRDGYSKLTLEEGLQQHYEFILLTLNMLVIFKKFSSLGLIRDTQWKLLKVSSRLLIF